jgi:hypothetical protein
MGMGLALAKHMIAASKNRIREHEKIFAYGFDRAGFMTPHEPIALNGHGAIEFVDFSSPKSLTEADGVIIPQGTFEHIETRNHIFGEKTYVWVNKSLLLERERQIFSLLRDGKWACFLVGEIVDHVTQGMHSEPILDTDLCKRILNAFMVDRRSRYRLESPLKLGVRDEEFKLYVSYYGTPATVFELPHDVPTERHAIVRLGDAVAGMEFDRQLFFLPFETSERSSDSAVDITRLVSSAIRQYRRYRISEVPHWVDDFHFQSEEALYLEINGLLERVNRLESELASWKDYKGILACSGASLRSKIVALLESVFEFKIQIADGSEAFVILKDGESPGVLVETDSARTGIEKACIDRVARSRAHYGLADSFPAALVINSDMLLTNVAARSATTISEEIIRHAANYNVLIVRTIDLLFLLGHLESSSNKKSRLLRLLVSGGGWLKADLKSYDIIHP